MIQSIRKQISVKNFKDSIPFLISGFCFSSLLFEASSFGAALSVLVVIVAVIFSLCCKNSFFNFKQSDFSSKIISLVLSLTVSFVRMKMFYSTWRLSAKVEPLASLLHMPNTLLIAGLAGALALLSLLFLTISFCRMINKLKTIIPYKSPVFILSVIITSVQTAIGLFLDRYIFMDEVLLSIRYLSLRLLLFFVLIFVWYNICTFFGRIKKKEKNYIIYLVTFLFFCVTYSAILILIWPGNWVSDEQWILEQAVYLTFNPWQHVLTSLFYIFSLMIFPSPVSVVIVQYTLISAIISYIIGKLYIQFKTRGLIISILFLFPSVIAHIFYPMRLILFGFIEMMFLFTLLNKKDTDQLPIRTLIFASILNVLLSVWRTECIFLIILLPLILLLKKYPKKVAAVFSAFVILSSGVLILFQNSHMSNDAKVRYNVTGIIYPFTHLLKEEYKNDKDSDLIKQINTYIDVEKTITYENGDYAFWYGGVFDGITTEEQFKVFLSDFIELVKKHPQALVLERASLFHDASYPIDDNGKIRYSRETLDHFNFENYLFSLPIDTDLRNTVMNLIYGNSDHSMLNRIITVSYNLYIPIALIMIMWLFCLIRLKNNQVAFISLTFLLAQVALVFVTAPGSRFMYYFPVLICGYSVFFMRLLWFIKEKKEKI